MSELRERVARAMYEADDPFHIAFPWPDLTELGKADGYRLVADAAIAAVLDAMQEPSEEMRAAWAMGGKRDDWRGQANQDWTAMLAAFRTEALPPSP